MFVFFVRKNKIMKVCREDSPLSSDEYIKSIASAFAEKSSSKVKDYEQLLVFF